MIHLLSMHIMNARYKSHIHSNSILTLTDELGNWRPLRNKFTKEYFDEYHLHIPKAQPEEDYDDRNALYALQVA